jgi:hypothetical protein
MTARSKGGGPVLPEDKGQITVADDLTSPTDLT